MNYFSSGLRQHDDARGASQHGPTTTAILAHILTLVYH